MTARNGARAAVLATGLLAACAGVFQHGKPPTDRWQSTTAVTTLRVGSAERDITPEIGGAMSGFDIGRTSTRVASPLAVRAFVIEADGRRLAIVGIDNLGLLREDVDWIKRGLAGFAVGDVFVCASHTHAGPDLIGLWGFWFLSSGRDRDYLAAVGRATVAAVAEALANAAPATLQHGEALLPAEGLVKNANRAGVFDRRLTVLHARAVADGRPLGTLLHFACHPEVLPRRNTALSADFVGSLCAQWQARGHGQAVFVNGALGAMISPALKQRDEQGVAAFGARACEVAEAALAAATPLAVDSITVRRTDVWLPMVSPGFRIARLTTVLPRELYDDEARSTVGWLRLGAFEAIAVPGEMEPVFAAEVRASLGRPNLLVFGLCDDEVGYLLRDQDASDPEFAYERSMSPCRSAGERVRAALLGR